MRTDGSRNARLRGHIPDNSAKRVARFRAPADGRPCHLKVATRAVARGIERTRSGGREMCVRVRESSPASECHPTPPPDRLFWLDLAQRGRPESVGSECGAVTLG